MKPLRSNKLREAAKDCPKCQHCGKDNFDGQQLVMCHPNGLKWDKGMGLKAHDLGAYLCSSCHDDLDSRTGRLTRVERDDLFLNAMYWSTVWLIKAGVLK